MMGSRAGKHAGIFRFQGFLSLELGMGNPLDKISNFTYNEHNDKKENAGEGVMSSPANNDAFHFRLFFGCPCFCLKPLGHWSNPLTDG